MEWIVEWLKGAAQRPFLDSLSNEADRTSADRFLREAAVRVQLHARDKVLVPITVAGAPGKLRLRGN